MKQYPFAFPATIALAGLLVAAAVFFGDTFKPSRPSLPSVETPHYTPSDNAIARFGLAPVNPDWVQVTHKAGQPIDGVPSHEWAVFTFAFEPKVEKIEQPNGATVWRVTFE